MAKRIGKISWNRALFSEMDKKTFVKNFGKVYPGIDLEAEYNKMFPPKKAPKVEPDPEQKPETDTPTEDKG